MLVLLLLALQKGPPPSYAALGAELGLTASEAHAAVERAVAAQLAHKDINGKPLVIKDALLLFVLHGARYCFPAVRGEITRGLPTVYAAAPIKQLVVPPGNEPPPVWPHKNGTQRGMTLYPLYPSVPDLLNKLHSLAMLEIATLKV